MRPLTRWNYEKEGRMIRINQIKLPIGHSPEELTQKITKLLKIKPEQLKEWRIVKKSIDARKKPELFYVYAINVYSVNVNTVNAPDSWEQHILKKVHDKNIMLINEKLYRLPERTEHKCRPVIAGCGPAGLFCAYALVLQGYRPIVAERGRKVEERTADVKRFWETGMLDVSSNVQFGEGGAGTFSDGKLNTLVKDPAGRNRFVLETFVRFGAQEEILYESKPHIGTDILAKVIRNMRLFLEEEGVEFRFETCVTDIFTDGGNRLCGVAFHHGERVDCDCLILAIGHSARDTFRMLKKRGLSMQAKSFAVGLRVEHPQLQINRAQYGDAAQKLPPAPYKVTANLADGRGVYSFCMCPGGYVVNASSEEGRLAVNGMSYSDRAGSNANSAVIVSVTPEDFPGRGEDPLSGVSFQEQLEERAYALAKGRIPQQLFGDFCENVPSLSYGAYESCTKGDAALCNLRGLLPKALEQSFIEGMHQFSHMIADYDRKDAILSGVESRTSSPVRITRGADFQSNITGVYPCGEGAGYAGGIMSAAMDGLKVAEAIGRNDAAAGTEAMRIYGNRG